MRRSLWQTEVAGQTALLAVENSEAVLTWPGAELRAATVEEVLQLAAADVRLPDGLYTRLLEELDLLAGGPPRPWNP